MELGKRFSILRFWRRIDDATTRGCGWSVNVGRATQTEPESSGQHKESNSGN